MTFRCRICKATRLGRESLIDHMAEHSPRLLADEVLRAVEHGAEMQRLASMAEKCGKVGYKTERAATNVLIGIWQKYGNDAIRRETRVYQCYRCDGRWHLTSQPSGSSDEVAS